MSGMPGSGSNPPLREGKKVKERKLAIICKRHNGTKKYLGVKGYKRQLSKTRGAIEIRNYRENLKLLVDLRICEFCKYAFISRGGSNCCEECIGAFTKETTAYLRLEPPLKAFPGFVDKYVRYKYGRRIDNATLKPRFEVPDVESPFVKICINDTFQKIKEWAEQGINRKMPRIIGLSPYPNVPERIFCKRNGTKMPKPVSPSRISKGIDGLR